MFGPGIDLSGEFLLTLQPNDVRSAYRRMAKQTHPDLFFTREPDFQKQQTERFRLALDSYGLVQKFFAQQKEPRLFSNTRAVHRETRKEKTPVRKTTLRKETTKSATSFYNGPLPVSHLEIGRFLYYRGKITYRSLIKALAWQRSQRPAIGEIALRWGWLTGTSLRTIVEFKGQPLLFGERCVHLGLFSPFQLRTLLAFQRTTQKKLGRYFVEQGCFHHHEMEKLVSEMKEHNMGLTMPRMRGK